MKRALIGGYGFVGEALAPLLVEHGFDVWAIRRRPCATPPGVTLVTGCLTDPATYDALPGPIDCAVYMASAGGHDDRAYRDAYVDGLGAFLTRLHEKARPPRRVLFTSSTGVYGQTGGEWVDEDSPVDTDYFAGEHLIEGERLVQGRPNGTVIRLGGLYGPGRTRLIDMVRRGEAVTPPPPPRYINLIHRDDAAGVIAHALALDAPQTCYLGVDCEPVSRQDLYRWTARALGVPEPPETAEDDGWPSRRRATNKRCDNRRLLASGYRFRHPTFREGYAALLTLADPG
jgi:nucleoside-diphosphate-sugar epimerase